VEQVIAKEPWNNSKTCHELVETVNQVFAKPAFSSLRTLFSRILGREKVITCLEDVPFLEHQTKKDQFVMLLATLLQNAMHDKNSARVESVRDGKYFTFTSPAQAKIFLQTHLRDSLMNRLKQAES